MDKVKIVEFSNVFYEALNMVLPLDWNDDKKITINDLKQNFNEIVMGMIFATDAVYMNLSGEEIDVLEYSHLINKLIVQYLMEYGILAEPEDESYNLDKENNNSGDSEQLYYYASDKNIDDDELYSENRNIRNYVRKYIN